MRDLSKTADFYESLGFRRGNEEPDRVTFYVNWFAEGMKPDGEPEVRASGNREFLLRDPDGYKLAFFQKK